MSAGITPGEWVVATGKGESGGIKHANGFIAFSASPRKASDERKAGESWLDMRHRTQGERDAIELEKLANERLIAEAGTVTNKTGLTPRQLADEWDELLKACRDAIDAGNDGDWQSARRGLLAAIAKATGAQ